MTKEALLAKIESLPPEMRAEVERLVDDLAKPAVADRRAFPSGLIDRINARREALRREHGLFDTLCDLHQLRETGGQ